MFKVFPDVSLYNRCSSSDQFADISIPGIATRNGIVWRSVSLSTASNVVQRRDTACSIVSWSLLVLIFGASELCVPDPDNNSVACVPTQGQVITVPVRHGGGIWFIKARKDAKLHTKRE